MKQTRKGRKRKKRGDLERGEMELQRKVMNG